ncbi:type II secretion system protein GspJ [Fimbriimonas ginsengisoli]|uniref:Type II secretion system protein J n=1 Tax=Fimbriimonas ginsengisoli Gsoil 348 TaxID=661478 RepID=A0A068NT90_FIMGI|nr:type II secretion system protein GspJ [Fimbriimonas ginsengisoli]AIE85985.1 hypothetical protein OP10G_2617 [Fimbriimonas ginsengisoli Gsoil 348]
MRERGLSLLELLIAVVIVTVATGAVTRAFILGIGYEQRFVSATEARSEEIFVEDTLRRLLSGAQLLGKESYLIAPVPLAGSGAQQRAAGSSIAGADSIVFTTDARELPYRYVQDRGNDWETLNQRFGPQGGLEEVAVSTFPVGDAGLKQGLFIREQCPPDSEPSRGGDERILNERIRDVRFEFYDGNQWASSWDSRNGDKDKLPAAIRVSYVLLNDKTPHSFLVRLPMGGGS